MIAEVAIRLGVDHLVGLGIGIVAAAVCGWFDERKRRKRQ